MNAKQCLGLASQKTYALKLGKGCHALCDCTYTWPAHLGDASHVLCRRPGIQSSIVVNVHIHCYCTT